MAAECADLVAARRSLGRHAPRPGPGACRLSGGRSWWKIQRRWLPRPPRSTRRRSCPDEQTLLDGTPISFTDDVGLSSFTQSSEYRAATARARRRFLGDDALLLAAGRTWPVQLADGAWWAFEILAGDSMTAQTRCLLREMLPVAIGWQAETAVSSDRFTAYRVSGAHLTLVHRPGMVALGGYGRLLD